MFTICSVGFFVPLIIIIFCYSRILHVMYSADNKLHRIRSGLPQPRLAKFSKTRRRNYTLKNIIPKRRVTVLVANLIISFVICWLPFHSWVSRGARSDFWCNIIPAFNAIIGPRTDGAYRLSLHTRRDILPCLSKLINEPVAVLLLGVWFSKSIL